MNSILDIDITEVAPPVEPVTVEKVREWLRIDSYEEDELLEELITSCRQAVENYTSCSLVGKEIKCEVDLCEIFELPYGPVKEIVGVKQGENVVSNYTATEGKFKKISGIKGCTVIEYTAGYDVVPQRLKLAVLNEIAFRYRNRGDQTKELSLGSTDLCDAALAMCSEYRRVAWT